MEKLKHNFQGGDKEIIELIKNYKNTIVPDIDKRNDYAKGNNWKILNRQVPDGAAPDNRVPVSYARRMINLVTGYMYKPGLITYAVKKGEDQSYLEAINKVFKINDEPTRTEQMGRQTSIQGMGYELFFNEGVGEVEVADTTGPLDVMPLFVKVPVNSIIPIYNYDIIPEMTHFIRFYTVEQEQTEYISVYDSKNITKYKRKTDAVTLESDGEEKHGFDCIPLVVYENNEDMIGDFSAVISLIDAYDVLMSDSLNEFDRFKWAYLLIKGFSISQEDAANIKDKKIIELPDKDAIAEFLTKDINHEFIQYMGDWTRGEIHRQSGIPNLDDYKFGGNTSGATLSKWIYLMELFTDPKISYFKQALRRRIEIITAYQRLNGDPSEIDIIMTPNGPDKSTEQAEIFVNYTGLISHKTLVENFADFVPDAEAEIEQLEEEQEKRATVDLDNIEKRQEASGDEDEEDEEEEEKEGK